MANYFSISKHQRYLADEVVYHPKINEIVRRAELEVRQYIENYLTIPDYDQDADQSTNAGFKEAMIFTIAEVAKRVAQDWEKDPNVTSKSVGPRSVSYDRGGNYSTYRLIRHYDETPPVTHL